MDKDINVFVPVSFRADRLKIKAIKIWGLFNERKLQDILDEALIDFMYKHNIRALDTEDLES